MPEFRRILDVYQGYRFKKDKQTPVGFLTRLTIGGTDLVADQVCTDPTNPSTGLKAVAVLRDVLWETGVTDAVYLSGQVSATNRQVLAAMLVNDLVSIDTTFRFAVYDFDPIAKKYFAAFHCASADLAGLLEKRGDEINLSVADDVSTEVQSPENYTLATGIKPKPEAQALHLATADQKNRTRSWGVAIG